MTRQGLVVLLLGAILAGGAAALVRETAGPGGGPVPSPRLVDSERAAGTVPSGHVGATTAGPTGRAVCGQPSLRSPYRYTGGAGPYASGTPGLPTYGRPGTAYPRARAGRVLAPEERDYQNWQLAPDTVYYLAPGVHRGSFSANRGDVFVGGWAAGVGSTLDGGYRRPVAIDSNISLGEQADVTIDYLTIQRFTPPVDQVAVNQTGNGGWTLRHSTLSHNVPGAGMFAASDAVLRDNCLTLNGQYGFQSAQTLRGDSLTGGPYNVWVEGNEISRNDTCGLSGLVTNEALGWKARNPVPEAYRDPHCGAVKGSGNQGGFKLWGTNGVMIRGNWIHSNWGVGGWVDTNNANTTWTGNTITDNENGGIWEETSYNFSVTDNYLARNNLTDGPGNAGFPMPAIYISESGSDSRNGGVPACAMPSCIASGMPGHPRQSVISGNTLVDNGGGIFLWQNANRFCNDGFDGGCTLMKGGAKGPFSKAGCAANLPGARLDRTTWRGAVTGSPAHDYWDGCLWQTQNVSITRNRIDFEPSHIPGCTPQAWPACGANGVFSQFGGPNRGDAGADIPTQVTFFQGNRWSENVYHGPSTFWAWNQGNHDNPVGWAAWTGATSRSGSGGTPCTTASARRSGDCAGPFGQDAGSAYRP